jgi:CubicO group peptidase (beta-lactamase class C family)
MRRATPLLLVALLLLPSGAPLRADDLLLDLFARYLDSLRREDGIPGLAVALVGEDDILWERSYGYQDVEQAIATRPDTPFHVNGLTQIFTAALVLRCVEENRLSLGQSIVPFDANSVEPGATIGQLLTHTSINGNGPAFAYRPDRLGPLGPAVQGCTQHSYRQALANLLDRLAMVDAVPGADAVTLPPGTEPLFDQPRIQRYQSVLARVATPYAVDERGRASRSQDTSLTLTPGDGLIASVRDLAQFDLALRKGLLLREDTLASSWQPPVASTGEPLPHAYGWFVQAYNGELVAWQFGVSPNASSALIIKVPARRLMLIALANSDRLASPFDLGAGNLMASPIGRLFLRVFLG